MNPPNPPSVPGSLPEGKKSGLAIASLVLGIAGIALCFGPIAGIPAVICGHVAQSKIRGSGGAISGSGLATAGLITGYISIAWIVVVGLLAAIAIPNFVKARTMAQTQACRSNLRQIQIAKQSWAADNKKKAADLPTETELFGANHYMQAEPQCPSGGTYSLNSVGEEPTCSFHGANSTSQH